MCKCHFETPFPYEVSLISAERDRALFSARQVTSCGCRDDTTTGTRAFACAARKLLRRVPAAAVCVENDDDDDDVKVTARRLSVKNVDRARRFLINNPRSCFNPRRTAVDFAVNFPEVVLR